MIPAQSSKKVTFFVSRQLLNSVESLNQPLGFGEVATAELTKNELSHPINATDLDLDRTTDRT